MTEAETRGAPCLRAAMAHRGAWSRCALRPSAGTTPADTGLSDVCPPELGEEFVVSCRQVCTHPFQQPLDTDTVWPPADWGDGRCAPPGGPDSLCVLSRGLGGASWTARFVFVLVYL